MILPFHFPRMAKTGEELQTSSTIVPTAFYYVLIKRERFGEGVREGERKRAECSACSPIRCFAALAAALWRGDGEGRKRGRRGGGGGA